MHQEEWMFMGWMWFFWIPLAVAVTFLFLKAVGFWAPEGSQGNPEQNLKRRYYPRRDR